MAPENANDEPEAPGWMVVRPNWVAAMDTRKGGGVGASGVRFPTYQQTKIVL